MIDYIAELERIPHYIQCRAYQSPGSACDCERADVIAHWKETARLLNEAVNRIGELELVDE